MSLKKYLRRLGLSRGQSAMEYFILLAVVTSFAIIGSSKLFTQARDTAEKYTNAATNVMAPETE